MYARIIMPCRQHGFIMAYKFKVLEWALFKPPYTSVSVYILLFEKKAHKFKLKALHECKAMNAPPP